MEASDSIMVDKKHGKTTAEVYRDAMKVALLYPHTLLPEPIKRVLRPIQESLRVPDFELDPFVRQIEKQPRLAA